MSALPLEGSEPAGMEPGFSGAELDMLARRMEARRDELAAEVREGLARTRRDSLPGLGETVGDDADRAFAEVQRGTDDAELQRDARELAAIEAALGRIARGEYGVCADCGLPIGTKRLLAQPSALRCLHCQEVHERTYAPPDSTAP